MSSDAATEARREARNAARRAARRAAALVAMAEAAAEAAAAEAEARRAAAYLAAQERAIARVQTRRLATDSEYYRRCCAEARASLPAVRRRGQVTTPTDSDELVWFFLTHPGATITAWTQRLGFSDRHWRKLVNRMALNVLKRRKLVLRVVRVEREDGICDTIEVWRGKRLLNPRAPDIPAEGRGKQVGGV